MAAISPYSVDSKKQAAIDRILSKVLGEVKPTEDELKAVRVYSNMLMGRLKSVAPPEVEIVNVGSAARGTQIRGRSDIDIFLLFPRGMGKGQIERMGLEIGRKIVDKRMNESYIVKYAEHPYTKVYLNEYNISADIVPAYKIGRADERGTAVDRTQLHNDFILSNMPTHQRDQVRLLKAFLKFHGIYGAEARIEGFSGYLCELLVLYYGSFIEALEGFANISLPLYVEMDERGRRMTQSKEIISKVVKDFGTSLVVIDPTDRNRNVAAVVSEEKLARLVLASRKFLSSPNPGSFYGPKHSESNARSALAKIRGRIGSDIFVMEFKLPDIAEDITWQQLKKLRSRIAEEVDAEGFNLFMTLQDIEGSSGIIAFLANRFDRRVSTASEGPGPLMKGDPEKFYNAHRGSVTFLSRGRISAITRARYQTVGDLLKAAMSGGLIVFPSHVGRKGAKLYKNAFPEHIAKMVYRAYSEKTSV
ncbi:MAG: CCA tRNA nucleotidyltransferase [Candidatus Micrarchaeota archaeon]|nr:CCA tRNA nucleotidyltransferase [Candidatus Micrarchaeota archaeon]